MNTASLGSFTFAAYSKVVHGFTTPSETFSTPAFNFNANAARRAWVAAFDLFSQAFDVTPSQPVPADLWTNRVILPRIVAQL